MTTKPMTKAELDNRTDIFEADKDLIERYVEELGGDLGNGKPDTPVRQGIRGFLVQELECQAYWGDDCSENVIDDELREEFEKGAASFVEGWEAAMEVHLIPDGFMCGSCGAMVEGEKLPEGWKTKKRRGGFIYLCPNCFNPPERGTDA